MRYWKADIPGSMWGMQSYIFAYSWLQRENLRELQILSRGNLNFSISGKPVGDDDDDNDGDNDFDNPVRQTPPLLYAPIPNRKATV